MIENISKTFLISLKIFVFYTAFYGIYSHYNLYQKAGNNKTIFYSDNNFYNNNYLITHIDNTHIRDYAAFTIYYIGFLIIWICNILPSRFVDLTKYMFGLNVPNQIVQFSKNDINDMLFLLNIHALYWIIFYVFNLITNFGLPWKIMSDNFTLFILLNTLLLSTIKFKVLSCIFLDYYHVCLSLLFLFLINNTTNQLKIDYNQLFI